MKLRTGTFLALGVLVALLLAGVVSWYASSSPDGLEKVASDKGFIGTAKDHRMADSPFADYGTKGVGFPSSALRRNIDSAPSTSATSVMSVMAWRAIRKKNGDVPTVRKHSHAARRLQRRASIHHMSVSPMMAMSANGRRMARTTDCESTISPE